MHELERHKLGGHIPERHNLEIYKLEIHKLEWDTIYSWKQARQKLVSHILERDRI